MESNQQKGLKSVRIRSIIQTVTVISIPIQLKLRRREEFDRNWRLMTVKCR